MISKSAAKTLLDIYVDEDIILYLKGLNIVVPTSEGTVDVSMMVEGVVLDIDEDFIHLGNHEGEVTKSVPHESVGLIEFSFAMNQTLEGELAGEGDVIN